MNEHNDLYTYNGDIVDDNTDEPYVFIDAEMDKYINNLNDWD